MLRFISISRISNHDYSRKTKELADKEWSARFKLSFTFFDWNQKGIVSGRIEPPIVPLATKDLRTESKWKNKTNLLKQERCLKLSFNETINGWYKCISKYTNIL